MFPILQWSKEPLKTTPEASLTITGDSWGRRKRIPSPGIPEHSASQQWPWSAVGWGHRDSNLPCKHWHWHMNQLWEAFTWQDCQQCHQWWHMVLQASGTRHTSNKLQPSEPLHSHQKQLDGYSSSPCGSCTEMVALDHLSLPWAAPGWSIPTFLFHLFHCCCKRDWDLAAANVIWPVWLLFNSQLSLSQPANSQLITASQQIQSLHQAREF